MINNWHHTIINDYKDYLINKEFPCAAARAAVARKQVICMVADNIACPKDDDVILQFLYDFVDNFRISKKLFHSAAIIFKGPEGVNEEIFDKLFWQRLQALANLDAENYGYDKRVDADPSSVKFSFSLKEEAFFIIGLHPLSSRQARRFKFPTLAFNPHAQFEQLRQTEQYEKMKNIIRRRDVDYSGSVNPMLKDFGAASEVFQYTGRRYDNEMAMSFKN